MEKKIVEGVEMNWEGRSGHAGHPSQWGEPDGQQTGHCRPVWSMVHSPSRISSEMGTKV